MRRRLVALAVIGMCSVALVAPAQAAQWNFETLDGEGGPNGRTTSSVGRFNATTLYGGQPHVWYQDESLGDLRHGWWNGSAWTFETLDGAGGANGRIIADVGRYVAVTLYGGQPHVWYANDTNADLRHGWWNGSAWSFETLDGAGGANGRTTADVSGFNSASLYGGQPHVWYDDDTNDDLRHGWWNGSAWSFETLDGAGGANGRITSEVASSNAATLYGNLPHVWYSNDTNGELRHGWWSGTAWTFETLDGNGGPNGRISATVGGYSAVTLYGGQPHVWYADEGNGDLRHAWWNGSAWSFETLDGAGGLNGRTTAAVGRHNAATLYGNEPHVWYQDSTEGDLRHGWWNGSAWSFETLDGAGGPNGRIDADVGSDNAVTLFGGQPHIWYEESNGYLRHAWYG